MSRERGSENYGCLPHIGCATPVGVLTLGLALSVFGSAIGWGCSVRIPLTEANISASSSIGYKERTRRALSDYLEERIGSNYDFVNSSTTLTIGPAEGIGILVVGNQPGAPWLDLNIDLSRP